MRLISATHCDLLQKIDRHEFREDLYYRLQGLTLTMPPLRERGDRRQLVLHLLAREQGDGENGEGDSERRRLLISHLDV